MKYPYNNNVIPPPEKHKQPLPKWLQQITDYISAIDDYAVDIKESEEYTEIKDSYEGALVYINAFASITGILYQHYDSLPEIYFNLLDKSISTISTKQPRNAVDKTDMAWCIKKIMLILQIAADKQKQDNEKYEELALKYYQQVKLISKTAAKISHQEYLYHLCRQLSERARVKAVQNGFNTLAKKYQNRETLIPEKKIEPRYYYLRNRAAHRSPTLFTNHADRSAASQQVLNNSGQQTAKCNIL